MLSLAVDGVRAFWASILGTVFVGGCRKVLKLNPRSISVMAVDAENRIGPKK